MKRYTDKITRDIFENFVTNQFKKVYPHFQFEHHLRRLPLYPKIVLYSNVPSVDNLVLKLFPEFRIITPKLLNETDQNLAKKVATQIINPNESEIVRPGVIIKGFPFNPTQALLLDRLLNGVNLALHVKGGSGTQEITSLLNYYDERGTLVEFDFKDNFSQHQLQNLSTKVRLSLKSSD